MKARRVSFVVSLPLALGLLGCGREDDGADTYQREVPTTPRTGDDGSLHSTEEPTTPDQTTTPDQPTTPDQTAPETGDPMERSQDFERGARTGPQQTNPDPTNPERTPGGGAND